MSKLPQSVRLVEVGPRDGLQNEAINVPLKVKIALIERLVESGLTHIEAGSFVSPKWVPQMADSAEVFNLLKLNRPAPGREVVYSALTPNLKGLELALDAGVREVAVFAAASESFSQKNINCTVSQSLERFEPVMARAARADVKVRGYVSCVLGCPYEGEVPAAQVLSVAKALIDMGCYEVSLGDTIGVGTPLAAARLVELIAGNIGVERVAVHFHDTYGQALANTLAALYLGVRVIDSSVAGLGGCPYAKGASGNLATEDVVYMLQGMGIACGVDLNLLIAAGNYISQALGRSNLSKVARALSSGGLCAN